MSVPIVIADVPDYVVSRERIQPPSGVDRAPRGARPNVAASTGHDQHFLLFLWGRYLHAIPDMPDSLAEGLGEVPAKDVATYAKAAY